MIGRDIANQRCVTGALECKLRHPRTPQRQRKKNQTFLHVAGDVEWLRRVSLERDSEWRSIGKHTLGGDQSHLSYLQQFLIDLQPGKAGTVGKERLEPLAHQPFKVAFRLLEMLRAQE